MLVFSGIAMCFGSSELGYFVFWNFNCCDENQLLKKIDEEFDLQYCTCIIDNKTEKMKRYQVGWRE